jgi:hypothetical protein
MPEIDQSRDILPIRCVEKVQVDDDIPPSGLLLDVEDLPGHSVQPSTGQWIGHIMSNHPELSTMGSVVITAFVTPRIRAGEEAIHG